MDWFSFNYKPKDFKKGDRDKTLPEILEMKPGKVGLDFFTKYEKEIVEAGLHPETISAIHFLSDLRNKGDIFDKCYKSASHAHMKRSSHRPMPAQQPTQQPVQMPETQMPETQMPEPVLGEGDERPLIETQSGGRRRRSRKHRTRKHRKGDHTECTHSGGKRTKHSRSKHSRSKHSRSKHSRSKHSRSKHSGGKRSRSKRRHRRTYKGGAVMGLNDVVNKSNPAPALPVYEPTFNTSV